MKNEVEELADVISNWLMSTIGKKFRDIIVYYKRNSLAKTILKAGYRKVPSVEEIESHINSKFGGNDTLMLVQYCSTVKNLAQSIKDMMEGGVK